LHAGKKPQIEYFEKKWKALMTRQKIVVTMEIMAIGN
jgi:hypothetical protein